MSTTIVIIMEDHCQLQLSSSLKTSVKCSCYNYWEPLSTTIVIIIEDHRNYNCHHRWRQQLSLSLRTTAGHSYHHHHEDMMTSSNGNIFRVTGPLWGEFTGPGEFPTQRPVTRSFDVFFDLRLINGWVNNREAGDLRRHHGHYDVSVMITLSYNCHPFTATITLWVW